MIEHKCKYGNTEVILTFATFRSKFKGTVELSIKEFRKLCPFSDDVDEGELRIWYIPRTQLLEYLSFIKGLEVFRDQKLTHEDFVDWLFSQLKRTLKPKILEIQLTVVKSQMTTTVCKGDGSFEGNVT